MSLMNCLYNAVAAGNPVLASTIIMNAPMAPATVAAFQPMACVFHQDHWTEVMARAVDAGDAALFGRYKEVMVQVLNGAHKMGRLGQLTFSQDFESLRSAAAAQNLPIPGSAVILDDDDDFLEESAKVVRGAGGTTVRTYRSPGNFIEDFKNYDIDLSGISAFFVDNNYDQLWARTGLELVREMRTWGVSSAIYIASSHFRKIGGSASISREQLDAAGATLGMPKAFLLSREELRNLLGLS